MKPKSKKPATGNLPDQPGETLICVLETMTNAFISPDEKWFENRIHPTKNKPGDCLQDISVRKKAKLALKETEDKYRALVETANDSVLIVKRGKLVFVNNITLKISGYSREEIIGKPFINLMAEEDRERVQESFHRMSLGEEVLLHNEIRFLRKSGTKMPAEIGISMIKFQGENAELVVIRDSSEHRQPEDPRNLEHRLLRTLINNLPSSVFVKDLDFRKTAVNASHLRRMSETLGLMKTLSEEEVIDKTDFDIYPRSLAEEYFKEDERVIRFGETILNRDEFSVSPSGKPVWELISKIPFRNDSGNIIGMIGIAQDITERKQAELEIENERRMLRTLIQTIPDMIWLKDPGGVYLTCNARFECFLGSREAEIIGKTDYDLFSREQADFFRMNDQKAVKARKPKTNLENLTFASDGYKGLFETIKTPMYNAAGELIGVLGISRDISELNRSKEALRENELKLLEAQKLAMFGNWELNLVSNTFYWSDGIYEIFEIEKGKFGASYEAFLNAIHPDDRAIVDSTFTASVKNRNPYEITHRLLMKDGSIKHVVERGITRYDEKGRPVCSIGTVQDITERFKVEEEIRNINVKLENMVREKTLEMETANRDLEAFAYSVSHDLRSPLRHIDGFSRLLRKSIPDPQPETIRYLKKISESSLKMSAMIDALLNFSRLGRKPVSKSSIDLGVMIRQIVEQYLPLRESRDIVFRIGNLPVIQGDPSLLQIVFENLLSNAVKYTAKTEHAVIEIGYSPGQDQKNTIYFKDNGAGFDMAFAGNLFNVFQRMHTSEEFEGTGIGLANVKQIIQKHGGTVRAEAEIGKGATFFITL